MRLSQVFAWHSKWLSSGIRVVFVWPTCGYRVVFVQLSYGMHAA